jgi:hypothetical protein
MRPNFIADADQYLLLRDKVGVGRIVELPPTDAGRVAKHIPAHVETVYVAASGVQLGSDYGVFQRGDRVLGVEWVRTESKPVSGEPECNLYRYLFGLSLDGSACFGYEVTRRYGNDGSGQVGDHWTDFDDVFARHFGES